MTEEHINGGIYKGKNVLFLTPFHDNSCGVGTFSKALSEQLLKRGNNVDVLEYSPWDTENPYKFIPGKGEETEFSNQESLLNFFKSKDLRYDVIHSHNQIFANSENEKVMKHFRKTPILTQIHMGVPYANDVLGDKSPHGEQEVLRQARMLGKSDKVIHLSKDLETLMKGYYGFEHPENTGVIYNFANRPVVDDNRVKELRNYLSPNGEKIFLYAGRLSKEKGILELIQGFKKARKKNSSVKLVICGGRAPDETLMKKLDKEMGGMKEGKDFVYEGRVPQKDLQNYYAASDFFIQPSHYEHFSVSLIESMAHKKPIIMTKVPSMKNVMKLNEENPEDRYAIPISKIGDSNAIAKAIDFAANSSKKTLDKIVKNAYGFYESDLTPDKIASQYEQEYENLISNKKLTNDFEHVYAIPISKKENLSKTVNSIIEKEDGSQIIVSPYGGYNLGEGFLNKYSKYINSGKLKVLKSDKRITKYKSNALNKAISESSKVGADYFTIALPGREVKDSYLSKKNKLDSNGMIYSQGENSSNLEEILKTKNPIDQHETMYAHDSFDKISGFWDKLGYAEDMDLYQKMLNKGVSISKYIKNDKSN